MTNFEKYKDEILEKCNKPISKFAITYQGKLDNCKETDCLDCIFSSTQKSCYSEFIKWLYEDYREPIVLDEFTKELLRRCYNNDFTYIAKDENGDVCIYKERPRKSTNGYEWAVNDTTWEKLWSEIEGVNIIDFSFLSWEDKEPMCIGSLIEEH